MGDSLAEPGAGTIPSSEAISTGKVGQNVNSATSKRLARDSLVENGRNKVNIECRFCSSRILNAGMSQFVETECSLPPLDGMGSGKQAESEGQLSEFWCVDDIYTFENIGFSNTVGKTKYLTCADCDRGPLGYHNLETKKSFVALSRVHHL